MINISGFDNCRIFPINIDDVDKLLRIYLDRKIRVSKSHANKVWFTVYCLFIS